LFRATLAKLGAKVGFCISVSVMVEMIWSHWNSSWYDHMIRDLQIIDLFGFQKEHCTDFDGNPRFCDHDCENWLNA
jgi:hypothetical protein